MTKGRQKKTKRQNTQKNNVNQPIPAKSMDSIRHARHALRTALRSDQQPPRPAEACQRRGSLRNRVRQPAKWQYYDACSC